MLSGLLVQEGHLSQMASQPSKHLRDAWSWWVTTRFPGSPSFPAKRIASAALNKRLKRAMAQRSPVPPHSNWRANAHQWAETRQSLRKNLSAKRLQQLQPNNARFSTLGSWVSTVGDIGDVTSPAASKSSWSELNASSFTSNKPQTSVTASSYCCLCQYCHKAVVTTMACLWLHQLGSNWRNMMREIFWAS